MPGNRSKRGLVVGSALVLASAAAVVWLSPPRSSRAATGARVEAPAVTTPHGGATPPGPLHETVHDRHVRDELRQRILAAWAAEGERSAAPTGAPRESAPANADGHGMDPAYIQSVVRKELFPMVGKCYEELLARSPKAAGRIELSYTILGEPEVAGVVDEVDVKAGGDLEDEKLTTCVRESMASIAFSPPKDGGKITVVYPIELAPDDPDEPKK